MPGQHTYTTITDWQHLDPAVGEAIRQFWLREQANVVGAEAIYRLTEVVAHIVDEDNNMVAVATVAVKVLPCLGQPMRYYRCFVGKIWHSSKLVRPLLRHTQRVLEKYARAHDSRCIGILPDLENGDFADTLRWATWPGVGFNYIDANSGGAAT